MSDKKPLRVLFCMGINQNFMDAPREEQLDVWAAFGCNVERHSRYGWR